MTPTELVSIGHRLYGRKRWKTLLAQALGVDRTTIHRLTGRAQIPGPYDIAVNAIWANAQARFKLEKEARKLIRQRAGKLMPLRPRKTRSDKKEKSDGVRREVEGVRADGDGEGDGLLVQDVGAGEGE